ncbi:MAG: lipocalin family protein [Chitinophagaceae bacterium]
MKMKLFSTKLTLLAISAIITLSIGCSKDDTQPTASEILSKSWIQTDLLTTVNGVTQSVFKDEYELCDQDNAYNFKSDGTFTITENTIKCDPLFPDVISSGTWTLFENGKKVTIDPVDEDPQTLDIEELTNTSMKASVTDNSIGVPIKVTFVYRAK